MIGKTVGFNHDHFIYEVPRPMRGARGTCSRCGVPFIGGDVVRIAAALDDDGYWHESCPTSPNTRQENDR